MDKEISITLKNEIGSVTATVDKDLVDDMKAISGIDLLAEITAALDHELETESALVAPNKGEK